MNGLQIATWIILAATFIVQGYTFWLMHKTAKIRKQTIERLDASTRRMNERSDRIERII